MLDDPEGGVRDPQVHLRAERKVCSPTARAGASTITSTRSNADGSGLRQLTDGPFDDIEPTYLPDGGIVFVSSRCQRLGELLATQVAVLYRCDADGRNIRPISSNNEHDNTPWALPDGRVLYTRWEYVDRSQVHYHHLWTMNPDGTGQSVFFGNLHPGHRDDRRQADPRHATRSSPIFSPGHGQHGTRRQRDGGRPQGAGPDDSRSARCRSSRARTSAIRMPLSEDCFLVAHGQRAVA